MADGKTMRGGFVLGVATGALACIGVGLGLAFLPATPTWTLWQLARALDRNDVAALTQLVDLPTVAMHALDDLTREPGEGSVPLERLAGAILSGRKVTTVFDDPENPLEVTGHDLFAAWWNMRRVGDTARLDLRAGDRNVHLILAEGTDLRWKIVGIRPVGALLRIHKESDQATLPPARRVPAARLPAWA